MGHHHWSYSTSTTRSINRNPHSYICSGIINYMIMEDLNKAFDKKFGGNYKEKGKTHKVQDLDIYKNVKDFIRQREKDLLEDIKEKVLQSLMWSDKHGKEEQFSALANYLDSKLKELSND